MRFNVLRPIPLILLLILPNLLASCGGGSNNSSGNPPSEAPGPGVLSYQLSLEDATQNQFSWYKTDRHGKATLLDDVVTFPDYDLSGFEVSPDFKRIIYWYLTDQGQTILTLKRLDTEETEAQTTTLEGLHTPGSLQWLPDSTGVIFIIDAAPDKNSLLLVNVGEANPVTLYESIPGQEVKPLSLSTDGSKVAVGYPSSEFSGNIASMYLIDTTSPYQVNLIETTAPDPLHQMLYQIEWSPYGNEFVYRAVSYGSTPAPPGVVSVEPEDRPLTLYRENGTRQKLGNPFDNAAVVWLSADRVMLDFDSRIDILDTAGGPLISHSIRYTVRFGARQLRSPDGRRIAFLDDTPAGEAQVHVLDIYSGEVQVVGPGSSQPPPGFTPLPTFDSELRWSPDGSWLAWNRNLDALNTEGELYAYNVSTGETQLVTSDLGSSAKNYPSRRVTWLPQGNVLNYIVRSNAGYEFTVTDLALNKSQVVSDLVEPNCYTLRIWQNNNTVLWNRCGDGVYLSSIDAAGGVSKTQLTEGDISSLWFSDRHQVAVIGPDSNTSDQAPVAASRNWQMYDFTGQRLHELNNPVPDSCCAGFTSQF